MPRLAQHMLELEQSKPVDFEQILARQILVSARPPRHSSYWEFCDSIGTEDTSRSFFDHWQ